MDFDFFLKAGTLVIGAIGAGKLLYELSIGKRGRMRDEYCFAKGFLDEVNSNPELHPFLRDKGYQAIAGDHQIGADEIEYLLSLKGPERALRDYVLGRPYLEHFPQSGDLQIQFRAKYERKWSRQWRLYLYTALYFALAFSACSPLVLSDVFALSTAQAAVAFAVCIAVFGPYAWFALKAAVRIHRAQMLVEHQHKHTQRIVVTDLALLARLKSSARRSPLK